jgi:hypothetical protein
VVLFIGARQIRHPGSIDVLEQAQGSHFSSCLRVVRRMFLTGKWRPEGRVEIIRECSHRISACAHIYDRIETSAIRVICSRRPTKELSRLEGFVFR